MTCKGGLPEKREACMRPHARPCFILFQGSRGPARFFVVSNSEPKKPQCSEEKRVSFSCTEQSPSHKRLQQQQQKTKKNRVYLKTFFEERLHTTSPTAYIFCPRQRFQSNQRSAGSSVPKRFPIKIVVFVLFSPFPPRICNSTEIGFYDVA